MLSTVVLVKRNGEALFIERDIWGLDRDGVPVRSTDCSKDRVFRFSLEITTFQNDSSVDVCRG